MFGGNCKAIFSYFVALPRPHLLTSARPPTDWCLPQTCRSIQKTRFARGRGRGRARSSSTCAIILQFSSRFFGIVFRLLSFCCFWHLTSGTTTTTTSRSISIEFCAEFVFFALQLQLNSHSHSYSYSHSFIHFDLFGPRWSLRWAVVCECVWRSFIECWLPLLLTPPPPLDHLFGAVARAKLARRVALALNYFAPSAAPATPPASPLPPLHCSWCCLRFALLLAKIKWCYKWPQLGAAWAWHS